MKIVQFKDGKFALRKLTTNGYMYKDLSPHNYDTWCGFRKFTTEYFVNNCRKDLKTVQHMFDVLSDQGTVYKEPEPKTKKPK